MSRKTYHLRGHEILAWLPTENGRLALAQQLLKLGFIPTTTADLREAAELAQTGAFTALIIDCKVDPELSAELQANMLPSPIPVLGLTWNTHKESSPGLAGTLTKPVTLAHLQYHLQRIIHPHHAATARRLAR